MNIIIILTIKLNHKVILIGRGVILIYFSKVYMWAVVAGEG